MSIDDAELLERVCLQIFERYNAPYTAELQARSST